MIQKCGANAVVMIVKADDMFSLEASSVVTGREFCNEARNGLAFFHADITVLA
jgi:hypothetical protein